MENLFLRSAELLVFLPVKAVFSQKFVEGTVVEMITEAIQVPRLSTIEPEEVPSDGISQRDACTDWLHNIPREGVVCAVLGQRELEEDDSGESLGGTCSRNVALLPSDGNLLLERLQRILDDLELVDEAVALRVADQTSVRDAFLQQL